MVWKSWTVKSFPPHLNIGNMMILCWVELSEYFTPTIDDASNCKIVTYGELEIYLFAV